jgi:hypothetical protein
VRIRAEAIGIPILFIVTRMFGHPKVLYNNDAIQFALAFDRMDLAIHEPHPPGYIWFVLLGRLFKAITGNDELALSLCSIALGLVVLILLQAFVGKKFGRSASAFTGILFCFSPMSWFFSVVGLNYMADALVAVASLVLFYRKPDTLNGRQVFSRALIGAMLVGFRPQAIIYILPVWIYFLLLQKRQLVSGIAGFIAGNAIWIGITMLAAGTVDIFAPAVEHAFRPDISRYDALIPNFIKLRFAVWQIRLYTSYTLSGGLWLLMLPLVVFFLRGGFRKGPFRKFFLVWTLPHLLFSLFVFIVQPGHFVYMLPALVMALGIAIAWLYDQIPLRVLAIVIGAIVTLSMIYGIILQPPKEGFVNVGYQEIKRNDEFFIESFAAIRAIDGYENAIVLNEDFRHIFYYMPEVEGIGFTFQRLNKTGSNPLILHAGKGLEYEPVKAEPVDVEHFVYRLDPGPDVKRVIYFGRDKWEYIGDDLKIDEETPSVGYIDLPPGSYIYFAPKRKWWAGDENATVPPESPE